MPPDEPATYTIHDNYTAQWRRGQELAADLDQIEQGSSVASFWLVHGDPVLRQLDEHDLVCYFIYTLSSWWEIPLIDRINANRRDNSFAIIMDVNPVPETYYRVGNMTRATPRERYIAGLKEMFPKIDSSAATAMFDRLRNGFSHNLFGGEPSRIRFDNACACPPELDAQGVLLVPPVELALSMVKAFVPKIAMLFVDPSQDYQRAFKTYMTGRA